MSNMPNAFDDEKEEQEVESSFVNTDSNFDLTDAQLASLDKEVKQTQTGFKIKTPITVPPTKQQEKLNTAAQFVKKAAELDAALASGINAQVFDPTKAAQVLKKTNTPIKQDSLIDYSKMTEEDVYNDSVPLVAKPFGDDDSLKITLKDQNYHPRWVNKDPRMLGKALKNGFIFITLDDLDLPFEVKINADVNGHFYNGDVVAMRILKSIYFSALRASHLRAVNAVSALATQKAAKKQAFDFLAKEAGSGFTEEFEQGKVSFYTPGVEI